DGQAAVLDAAVDAHHLVVHGVDRDAWAEEVGREDDAAVGQPDLTVLDPVGSGLRLLVFHAVREMPADPGGDLLMVVLVAARTVPYTRTSPVVGSHCSE